MNVQEAADLALAIRGLVTLACLGFAGTAIFAMLFGTVRPRLRRMIRHSKRQTAAVAGLKLEHVNLTLQNESLARQLLAIEKLLGEEQLARSKAELESRRNLRIREKTETALIDYRKQIGK